MRCDQMVGLHERARKLVKGEQVLLYTIKGAVRVYPDGREEPQEDEQVYGSTIKAKPSGESFSGMFEEHPLNKYTFRDGKVYYERVQDDPWSSGPVIFLALQDEEGNWIEESLWSDEEIDEYI